MGTRGAYGFRVNGADKVTYNHLDSYPSGLGKVMYDYIMRFSIDDIRKVANDIVLVSEGIAPTQAQADACREAGLSDIGVGERNYKDWYCLLRNSQGDVGRLHEDKNPRFMIDSSHFLMDSLFCEWAYIINLDYSTFEIYRGLNTYPKAKGRYAGLSVPRPEGGYTKKKYYGVRLLKEIPLWDLKTGKVEFNAIEKQEDK